MIPSQEDRNDVEMQKTGVSTAAPTESDVTTAAVAATLPTYNLEHGFSSERAFQFGPFMFHVTTGAHLDSRTFSSSGDRLMWSSVDENDGLVHHVTPRPARPGMWTATAVVEEHPALNAPSLMFPALPFLTGKDDLAMILWFLTGREVAVGVEKSQRFMLGGTPDRLVSANYFHFPTIDWSALPVLAKSGANDAVYAVCLALSAPDLILKIAVSSGALDGLTARWYSDTQPNPYTNEVSELFKQGLGTYEAKLSELGVAPELIADVLARIPARQNASALLKLMAFLVAHGMLDPHADQVALGRVKLLNVYRNTIAHGSKIRIDPKASVDRQLLIAAAVSSVVLKICRVYVAKHLLKVLNDDYGVEKDEAYVREFFLTGLFHDQDIFTESYEEFIRRVDAAWTSHGALPGLNTDT